MKSIEHRYRDVTTTIPDWVWEIDADGRYKYSDATVTDMIGYSAEEIIGRHCLDIVDPEEGPEIAATLNAAFRTKTPFLDVPMRVRTKDGHTICLEMSGIPLIKEDGRLLGYRGVAVDATGRRRVQERLLRAERAALTGCVVQRIAHDFNNLLTPLVRYPDLIRMRLPADHPAVSFCDAILGASLQMATINESLLALGQGGLADDETVNLNRVVIDSLGRLGAWPPMVTSVSRPATDLLPVTGSSAQLTRAVVNLLTNAREAVRDKGVIGIKTENIYIDEPTGQDNHVEIGEYVRLEISDTGHGIPPEIRDRIFDPFFTTKPVRSQCEAGLGLSVVHAIVEGHLGYVDVESEVGYGTRVSIYLPVDRDLWRGAHDGGGRGGSETLLVVDDDVDQRELATYGLGVLGYRVRSVVSGEEAVAYLSQQPSDLVILDMVMPPGIDGAEAYRRILRVRPGQRAIILSGSAESERTKTAQLLGAGAFLRKPVPLNKLARAVRRELDRR